MQQESTTGGPEQGSNLPSLMVVYINELMANARVSRGPYNSAHGYELVP